jgi:hypothetical protein
MEGGMAKGGVFYSAPYKDAAIPLDVAGERWH